jgi:hydroxyacylglutathione hydrolase
VLFKQFVDDDLGCASYLVGDEVAGVAVVIDPAYAIDQYLEEAAHRRVRLLRVLETHTHADHVSGHGRLALEHGLPVSIHPAAGAGYTFDALAHDDLLEIGAVAIRCLHTPGHRPEHCCFVITDRSRGEEPWLVATGDSLFVGDVGRPDLGVEVREGAAGLFHSLRRLLQLPDGVEVFPGHVAGSLCGRSMSSKASSTIGFERRLNPVLQLTELDDFVAEVASNTALRPPNMNRIVELNRGPFLGSAPRVEELPAPPDDAQLLDVRPLEAFVDGHRHGAVLVPVSGPSFATKAGFVLDPGKQVCVLALGREEAMRAIRGLHSVAVLDVAGYVLGGGPERMQVVAVEELEAVIAAGAELIDVREQDERHDGYIPGSRNISYRLLALSDADVPTDRPVVTICSSGARAAVAASILAARGVDARPVVHGGVPDWQAQGRTTVEFRRCGA